MNSIAHSTPIKYSLSPLQAKCFGAIDSDTRKNNFATRTLNETAKNQDELASCFLMLLIALIFGVAAPVLPLIALFCSWLNTCSLLWVENTTDTLSFGHTVAETVLVQPPLIAFHMIGLFGNLFLTVCIFIDHDFSAGPIVIYSICYGVVMPLSVFRSEKWIATCQLLNDKMDQTFGMCMCTRSDPPRLAPNEVPDHTLNAESGLSVPDQIVFRMRDIDRPGGLELAPLTSKTDRLGECFRSEKCTQGDCSSVRSKSAPVFDADESMSRISPIDTLELGIGFHCHEIDGPDCMHGALDTSARKRFFDTLHDKMALGDFETPAVDACGANGLAIVDPTIDAGEYHSTNLAVNNSTAHVKDGMPTPRMNGKFPRKHSPMPAVQDRIVSDGTEGVELKDSLNTPKQKAEDQVKQRYAKRMDNSASANSGAMEPDPPFGDDTTITKKRKKKKKRRKSPIREQSERTIHLV